MSYQYLLKDPVMRASLELLVAGRERPKYFKRPIVPLLQAAAPEM
jgi:hypothetical protein